MDQRLAGLARATPESQGVDPHGLLGLLDAWAETPDVEMHSLMLLRHGAVVAAGWWAPYRAGLPHLLYSLSKSFTSTAAGLAVDEGLLDLDATRDDGAARRVDDQRSPARYA